MCACELTRLHQKVSLFICSKTDGKNTESTPLNTPLKSCWNFVQINCTNEPKKQDKKGCWIANKMSEQKHMVWTCPKHMDGHKIITWGATHLDADWLTDCCRHTQKRRNCNLCNFHVVISGHARPLVVICKWTKLCQTRFLIGWKLIRETGIKGTRRCRRRGRYLRRPTINFTLKRWYLWGAVN